MTMRRLVIAAALAALYLPASAPAAPRVDRVVLDSPALGGPVRVAVVAPDVPGRLPLVLLLHGLGGSEQTWLDADKGDAAGLAARFPAVYATFDGGEGFYTDAYDGGRRGTPAYERFVLDELLPYLRRTYPLRSGRAARTVIGASMGGYGAMLLAARRPDIFGRAVSLSGFVHPSRPLTYPGLQTAGVDAQQVWGPPGGAYLAGHDPVNLLGNLAPVSLYLAAGDGIPTAGELDGNVVNKAVNEIEVRGHAEDVVAAAHRAGLDPAWRPRHGVHGWPSWRRDIDDLVAHVLGTPVPPRPTSWTHTTVAQQGRAWDVAFRFAEPPAVLERFTRDGDTLRGDGSGRVTLRVRGCPVVRTLPFELTVPSCRVRGRPHAR